MTKLSSRLQHIGERILTAPQRPLVNDLAVAALILGIAISARLALDWVLPSGLPYITFLPAIIFTALFCGPIASIAAAAASAVAGVLWLDNVEEQGLLYHAFGLGIYCVVAGGILFLAQGLKQTYGDLLERNRRLELLTGELNHRMRNLFQVSTAIVSQSLRDGSVDPELVKSIASRFQVLSQSQKLVALDGKENVSMAQMAATTVATLAPHPSRLIIEGPPVTLPADSVMPLGLVLHELVTNAVKHGAWSGPKGRVKIVWRQDEDKLVVLWQESDGPPIGMPTKLGAGSKLIRGAISEATVDYHLERDGAKCRIELHGFPRNAETADSKYLSTASPAASRS